MNRLITKIKTLRECSENSEDNTVCLTFDVDWACDEVIEDTLKILGAYNIPSTWFFTHHTHVIDKIRCYEQNEIGIHPNFNNILNGAVTNVNVDSILSELKLIVPDATSLRSHSLTYGDVIAKSALKHGIKTVSNILIPFQSNIILNSWIDWYGLIHIPYFFQDSVMFYLDNNKSMVELINDYPGLKVFNFHPIHVFLNSESIDRYENTRQFHRLPANLIKYRYNGYGTRTRLIDLLNCLTNKFNKQLPSLKK